MNRKEKSNHQSKKKRYRIFRGKKEEKNRWWIKGWPGNCFFFFFLIENNWFITDEWDDERVVLVLRRQLNQGWKVVDVAVGVGHKEPGPHLQLHLNSLPQNGLSDNLFFFSKRLRYVSHRKSIFKSRSWMKNCGHIPWAAASGAPDPNAVASARPCAAGAGGVRRPLPPPAIPPRPRRDRELPARQRRRHRLRHRRRFSTHPSVVVVVKTKRLEMTRDNWRQ